MPAARHTDPRTSHEAAARVTNLTATQQSILQVLQRPRTDSELVEAYRNLKNAPRASESGIRSRRDELVKRGLVRDAGIVKLTPFGRRSIVWERTNAD